MAFRRFKKRSAFRRKPYRRSYGGRKFSKKARAKSTPRATTFQNDVSLSYRRRPMPRVRKRRYMSFVRRTKAIIAKSVAASFLLVNRYQNAPSAVNKQWNYDGHIVNFAHLQLGAVMPALENPDDILKIHARVVANAADAYASDRFVITGWTATTVVTNTWVSATEPTGTIVEAYYWRAKRDAPLEFMDPTTDYSSTFGGIWTASTRFLVPSVPSGGSSLEVADLGLTPFQGSVLAKYITIYKKTRTMIDGGKTAVFEQRSSKDTYINMPQIKSNGLLGGKTEGIFFVYRGVPNGFGQARAAQMSFSTSIGYTYRLLQLATSFGGENATGP